MATQPPPFEYSQGADPELEKRIDYAMQNIDSSAGSGKWEGGGHNEAAARKQWAQWDKWRDPGCPPDRPFKNQHGWPGCYEKPVDTPDGVDPNMRPDGTWDVANTGQNRKKAKANALAKGKAWPGGGAGGAGGSGGGSYGSTGNAIFDYMRQSGLDAAKDPEAALRTYMGYGGAQQYQDQVDQIRAEAEALPPGPARDAAIARLNDVKNTGLASMRQGASAAARGDLSGMLGTEQGYAQLAENARQANQSNALGWGGINLNRDLGFSNLAENQRQFDQNLGFNRWQTEGGWGLQGQALNQNNPTGAQKWLGGANAAIGLGKGIYDLYKQWKPTTQTGAA